MDPKTTKCSTRNEPSFFADARLLRAQENAKLLGKFATLAELEKQLRLDPPLPT